MDVEEMRRLLREGKAADLTKPEGKANYHETPEEVTEAMERARVVAKMGESVHKPRTPAKAPVRRDGFVSEWTLHFNRPKGFVKGKFKGASDKVYIVTIIMNPEGNLIVEARWGGRGKILNVLEKGSYPFMEDAEKRAHDIVREKIKKGYTLTKADGEDNLEREA